MAEHRYLVRRIENTATYRAHSVQCLNGDGVVIALAATQDGDDFGIAICDRVGESWAIKHVIALPEPTIRGINGAGQFAGWSSRGGRERALLGRVDPLEHEIRKGHAALTGIDAAGRCVGFRLAKGELSSFLHDGERVIDLEPPPVLSASGFLARSIGADRILGEGNLSEILVWDLAGKLIDRIERAMGEVVGGGGAGSIVCKYGFIADGKPEWFPYAPRCSDFNARGVNASGWVVGLGRALDRDLRAHACLWRGGESFNLNDLVDAPTVHLREADAINEGGWIACTDSEGEPVILEPVRR
ncbi:MAG: hypothetical protein ABL932_14955 [Terricaulis sp.]